MKRLTTPTHKFTITDVPLNSIQKVRIDYSQGGETLIQKTEADVTMTDNAISCTLTQEETARLSVGKVRVQLRILTTTGKALASNTFTLNVEDVINEEVLSL